MNALLELAERCEQAAGSDLELDARILATIGGHDFDKATLAGTAVRDWDAPAYTASLDAAMTLVPEYCQYTIEERAAWLRFLDDSEDSGVRTVQSGLCATTPLALCAAALRATAASRDAPKEQPR